MTNKPNYYDASYEYPELDPMRFNDTSLFSKFSKKVFALLDDGTPAIAVYNYSTETWLNPDTLNPIDVIHWMYPLPLFNTDPIPF